MYELTTDIISKRLLKKTIKRAMRDKSHVKIYGGQRWVSDREHIYYLVFDGSFNGVDDKFEMAWTVHAGCRVWRSFKEMKKHYTDKHWHYEWTKKERKHYRKRPLEIRKSMKRFCRKYNIKLKDE